MSRFAFLPVVLLSFFATRALADVPMQPAPSVDPDADRGQPRMVLGGNDPRPFTLVEDTYPEGKGAFEIENTLVYSHRTRDDHGYNALDVEHEIEFGINEWFDLKIPIAYRYESSKETDSLHFDSIAIQGDFYLTNSVTAPVGVGIFFEVGFGESALSFEQTLVLQKDFGRWVVAYNLGFATEINGVFTSGKEHEVTGTLVNSLGVSYSITPHFQLGGQISAESSYADWSHYDGTTVYAGPVINYSGGKNWWLTVGPSFQLTSTRDEPQYRLDFILAIAF